MPVYRANANELCHHGIKGQKWGVRRFQDKTGRLTAAGKKRYNDYQEKETAYREKLTKISKRKDLSEKEKELIKYRNNSMTKRYGGLVVGTIVGDAINAAISGAIRGQSLDKTIDDYTKNFTKRLPTILAKNVSLMAKTDFQAKVVAERYTDEGKKNRNPNKKLIATGNALAIAEKALPLAMTVGAMKMSQVNQYRKENEAKFNKWGANILEAKYDNIVNLGEDSYRVTSERDARTNYRPGAVKDAAKNAYKNVNQFANDVKYTNEYHRRKKSQ